MLVVATVNPKGDEFAMNVELLQKVALYAGALVSLLVAAVRAIEGDLDSAGQALALGLIALGVDRPLTAIVDRLRAVVPAEVARIVLQELMDWLKTQAQNQPPAPPAPPATS